MRFGLFGSAQARRGDGDPARGFRDYVDTCVEAESLGFDSSFLVEHHFSDLGQVSASLDLLAWVAARTTTMRLGTAVIVLPWHNPVLLAERTATLDLMSGGRLEFGVGKGYRHSEFAGFCIPYEEARGAVRGGVAGHRQGLDIERAVLAQRQVLASTKTSSLSLLLRKSRIRQFGSPLANRIRYAGSPRAAANCCSTSSHQLKPSASGSRCSERSARRAGARSILWTSRLRVISTLPATPPMLQTALARLAQVHAGMVALSQHPDGRNRSHITAYAGAPGATEASALYGTPDRIAAELEALRAVGVQHVLLHGGESTRQSVRRFSTEIMPAFTRPH